MVYNPFWMNYELDETLQMSILVVYCTP